MVVPHAGYIFSGKAAAVTYQKIVNSKIDLFIIFGTNHSGLGNNFSVSLRDFETPLGIVKTDIEFAEQLIKKSYAENDEQPHNYEHSIEVQLPFLQILSPKSKIIAIAVKNNDYNSYKKFASDVADLIKEIKKKVCVIASSDFTHYGYAYHYTPFTSKIKENLYKLDEGAIKKILAFDAKGFLDYIEKTKTTICGFPGIACCIEICKLLGSSKAEKLVYYTSGDVSHDYENAVGYAGIVFK